MIRLTIPLFLLTVAAVRSAVIDITPAKDNTLYQTTDGSLSNGQGQYFFAGNNSGGGSRRGLVEFDVGGIPAGATINSASLLLFADRGGTGAPITVNLHRLTREWGEGGSAGGSNEGGGALALTGDATWLHAISTSVFWTGAGAAGDFITAPSAAASLIAVGQTYTWTGLAADVQGWVNDASSNHGWIVIGGESANSTALRFASLQNTNAQLRPLLRVDFTAIPEPGAAAMVVVLAGGMILRRRR